ncbi:hypothetical protein QOT17_014086 [Balamuthia mandrillaris]
MVWVKHLETREATIHVLFLFAEIPSLKAAAEIKEQKHSPQEDSLSHHYYHTPDDLPFDLTKVFCERMEGASVFEAKMKSNGKMIVAKFEPSSSQKSQARAESQVLELLSTTLKEEPCFLPKWEGFIQVGFMDVLCTSPVGQGTLADLLSTKGKDGLAASTLFLLASNVSKALQQLHSCNLMMRDLHEANIIFLSSSSSSSSLINSIKEFRLIDLGLAAAPSQGEAGKGWDKEFGFEEMLSVRTLLNNTFDEQSDYVSMLYVLWMAAAGKALPWQSNKRDKAIKQRLQVEKRSSLNQHDRTVQHVAAALAQLDSKQEVHPEQVAVVIKELLHNLWHAQIEEAQEA